MNPSDAFALALVLADMPDDDVTAMATSGVTTAEIAERVAARSGRPVRAHHVEAWLSDIGVDLCPSVDGRAACETPLRYDQRVCDAHERH